MTTLEIQDLIKTVEGISHNIQLKNEVIEKQEKKISLLEDMIAFLEKGHKQIDCSACNEYQVNHVAISCPSHTI